MLLQKCASTWKFREEAARTAGKMPTWQISSHLLHSAGTVKEANSKETTQHAAAALRHRCQHSTLRGAQGIVFYRFFASDFPFGRLRKAFIGESGQHDLFSGGLYGLG